jgi:hypothetical protein
MKALCLAVLAVSFSLPAVALAGWKYDQKADAMRGANTSYASVISDNMQSFSFPYEGGSRIQLIFRLNGPNDFDGYLQVDKGQFSCPPYGYVSVKVDSGNVEELDCSYPDDGDTSVIFLKHVGQLMAKLQNARTLIIEAEFYREGRRQFNFNVSGFQWTVSFN